MQAIEVLENNTLNKIQLQETINIEILDKLIQSDLLQTVPWINPETGEKVCFDNEKAHLLAIRKKVSNKGILNVKYQESKVGFGRVYPDKSLSLCSIRRELRHTLAKETYVDIDVDNCHPVILKQICEQNNIGCTYLSKYVKERPKYLKTVMDTYNTDRETAKNLFIRLAYFGSFEAWKDEFDIESSKTLKFIREYTNELKGIGLEIVSANPKLLAKLKKHKEKSNITATLVSTILQEYEKRILECVHNYLRRNGVINRNAVLCFDGIMIPKDKYSEKLLTQLSTVVKKELSFAVGFSQKEMNQDYLEKLKDVVDKDSFKYKSEQFELNHCKIVNRSLYLKHNANEIITMTGKAVRESYCHLTCDVDESSFINKWMNKNENIKCYEDMNMYPEPLICPSNTYNLWLPFEIAQKTGTYEKNENGLNFILKHIKIICDNEESVSDYVTKWMAQMLQFPATKTTALAFVGKQGAGKSSVVRICEALIGKNKVLETTDPSRDCWGDFNGQMLNAFLVSIPELKKKDFLQGHGKINGIITDPTITINSKGTNQITIKSFHRMIYTSNNDDPVATSKDDRRNVVIRTSDELLNNKIYFDTLYEYLKDINTLRTIYDYLMSIPNMDEFDKIPLPKTKHQEELRKLDLSVPEQFLCDLVEKADGKDVVEFTSNEMFNLFNIWKMNNQVEYNCSKIKLGMKLSVLRVGGFTSEHRQVGNVRILNIKELKEHFNI